MKFLKLNVSSDIFETLGHPLIFEHVIQIEVLNILQYGSKDLYLLEKIVFKKKIFPNWTNLFVKHKTIKSYYLLKEYTNQNSILCLMRIKKRTPFWPKFTRGDWAILPPIIIDSKSMHINLLIPDKLIPKLFSIFKNISNKYELLAINRIDETISNENILSPMFTTRQSEIYKFAFRNGYFETPKKIHAKDIADKFHISASAVTDHLRKASYVALKYFFS